ncbi:hypothetical protein PSHT_03163 [Puccinia striiformis]|uniref:Uncharacterized protein n=1 Tax=Puccinia striiformis TaxID=27350 RepID=A0A2S4WG85_9BASI|nr:hypothetical protein PSHT_03163 [Puccinia striiformis]
MDHVLEPEHMDLHRCNFWVRNSEMRIAEGTKAPPVAVFSLIKPTRQKEVSDGEFAKSHRNWILFFRHSHKHYKSCYHNVHRWVIIRDLDSRCPQSHLTAMELYIHGMCRYQVEHIAQAGHPKVIGQVELVEMWKLLISVIITADQLQNSCGTGISTTSGRQNLGRLPISSSRALSVLMVLPGLVVIPVTAFVSLSLVVSLMFNLAVSSILAGLGLSLLFTWGSIVIGCCFAIFLISITFFIAAPFWIVVGFFVAIFVIRSKKNVQTMFLKRSQMITGSVNHLDEQRIYYQQKYIDGSLIPTPTDKCPYH